VQRATIWLVGMMGAGKSSVAAALGRRLGLRTLDTDAQVEAEAGMRIAEIFAAEGEAGFRVRERRAIEALAGSRAVVALGGGAIAQPGIAARLGATGTVVYLRASPETLARRVGRGRARPLLAGLDAAGRRAKLAALLAEREPAYRTAALSIDTDGRPLRAIVDELAAALAGSAS
jgi:shikimate kinase